MGNAYVHSMGFILAAAILSACQTVGVSPETEAILVQPTDACRAELRATIARMVNASSAALTDDALTRESLVIIEKKHPRDASGLPMAGRDFDKPEQFRLMKINNECVLIRLRTSVREALRECGCVPLERR